MNRLDAMVDNKLSQWEREACSAARQAIKMGRTATLVIYPTGLQMMRFAEEYKDFGMHFEVSPENWERINSELSA